MTGQVLQNSNNSQHVTLNVIERVDSNENNETPSLTENFTDDQLFGSGPPEEEPTSNAGFGFSSFQNRNFADIMSNFQPRYQSRDTETDEVD